MRLNEDLLPSVNAIAEYLYGEASKKTVRRVRHLIDRHGLPVKRVGGRIEGRRTWCDAFYAQPDSDAST
jgi:hypothetical protein